MSEPFLGEIQLFGFNFAPRGWAHCDGQLLPISSNTALFALLGTTYGGDGRTTFGLPDIRGRVPIHPGTGPGLPPVFWGQKAGANSHTLTAQQLPAHNHSFQVPCQTGDGDTDEPGGHFPAKAGGGETVYADSQNGLMGAGTTAGTGNSQSFSLMQPFIGIYYSIALVGLFPSRT